MNRGYILEMTHPRVPNRIVVINDDAVERGGAAAIVLASIRQFRQREIPVTLLSGGNEFDPELARLGVDAVGLGGRHILDGPRGSAALRGLFDPSTRAALARWLRTHDTPGTIYHLHNWHKVLSPSIFGPLRRVLPRLVITAHDYFLVCPNGGYFLYPQQTVCELDPGGVQCMLTACDRRHHGHKLWRVVRDQLRRRTLDLGAADAAVIAVHEAMVPHLTRGGIAAASLRVLRNPVSSCRSHRVPAERNRKLFYIGRLDADKGVDLLARAARLAGAPLCIIGDGPLAGKLAREHPEAELLGWRTREEIDELIGEARLLAVPTRCRETFGLAAIEALRSGVPVVVSEFSLISGDIVQQGFGLACNPYDETAFSCAIAELMRDDDRVRVISCHAFAEARKLAPTPAEWCDSLLSIYRARLPREAGEGISERQMQQCHLGRRAAC